MDRLDGRRDPRLGEAGVFERGRGLGDDRRDERIAIRMRPGLPDDVGINRERLEQLLRRERLEPADDDPRAITEGVHGGGSGTPGRAAHERAGEDERGRMAKTTTGSAGDVELGAPDDRDSADGFAGLDRRGRTVAAASPPINAGPAAIPPASPQKRRLSHGRTAGPRTPGSRSARRWPLKNPFPAAASSGKRPHRRLPDGSRRPYGSPLSGATVVWGRRAFVPGFSRGLLR